MIDLQLQKVIVSSMMKNAYILELAIPLITESYFPDSSCKLIYRSLSSYYSKYQELPNLNELQVTISELWHESYGVSQDEVLKVTTELWNEEAQYDENFVRDQLELLIKKVRSAKVLNEFVNSVSENDNSISNEHLVHQLHEALNVKLQSVEIYQMSDKAQLQEAREKAVGSGDVPKVIKSSFPTINATLQYGGYPPGTMHMAVAPPGCFVGDTKIMSSDGNSYNIEDLYKIQNSKNIYGCSKEGSIREVSYESIYLSKYTKNLVEIEINNQYVVKCTPDHPFMISTGAYCQAKDLSINDKLRSIYRDKSSILVKNSIVTSVKHITLDEKVPVYGIVDAGVYHNYAIALNLDYGVIVSNTGKSMFLMNEAYGALLQGKTVLHVIIGDLQEYDITIRYLSLVTKITQSELVMKSLDEQYSIISTFNTTHNGIFDRLFTLEYAAESVTVDQLVADIHNSELRLNVDYDMIVIDYPDNLISHSDNSYKEGGRVYARLEKLARDTQSVVYTASQPKTGEWNTEIMSLNSASESSKKQAAIDTMINLNKPRRDANIGTLHLAKVRKGQVGVIARYQSDFARCSMKEIDESQYKILKDELSYD